MRGAAANRFLSRRTPYHGNFHRSGSPHIEVNLHYYQHNIGDYARDTSHLTALEHGIYRLLLDWCYLNEKPLPTELAIRLGRGNPEQTQSVLSGFFSQENEGWVHKRVQKEVAAYQAKAEQNRKNGRKGGRKTQKEPKANPELTQPGSESNPNSLTHKPINIFTSKEANASVGKPTSNTPFAEVVAAYHEKLPELSAVRLETEKRKRAARGFWTWVMTSKRGDGTRRAETREQGLAFVSAYFERASANDFLMGRTPKAASHQNWKADFDFIISEKGRIQVVEKTQ
jgi:uncharacterized protein YdaU (DUF1376 family)